MKEIFKIVERHHVTLINKMYKVSRPSSDEQFKRAYDNIAELYFRKKENEARNKQADRERALRN